MGIPIATKNPISIEEYFSTGRDKNTGEYKYISSYNDFINLGEIIGKNQKKIFSGREIGKATINIPTKEKDEAKANLTQEKLQEIDER